MQKLQKLISLALLAMPSALCLAQSEQVTVSLTDGTTQTFAAEHIDSITFSDSQPQTEALSCSLDKVESVYAQFTITPAEGVGGYNAMYLEKSEFDEYESDEAVVADDILYFTEMAEAYGMTLADVIEAYLYTGTFTEWMCGLTPDTDYVLWFYGLGTDGKMTTPMQKVTFHTPAAAQISNKIDIKSTTADDTVTVTYTPDDDNIFFANGFIAKSEGLTDEEIQNEMQLNISESLYDWLSSEEPVTNALGELASKGTVSVTPEGMTSGKDYYAVAAYVNDEGAICSPLFKTEVGSNSQGASAAPAKAKKATIKHRAVKHFAPRNNK